MAFEGNETTVSSIVAPQNLISAMNFALQVVLEYLSFRVLVAIVSVVLVILDYTKIP
jgi:hypothetical protein